MSSVLWYCVSLCPQKLQDAVSTDTPTKPESPSTNIASTSSATDMLYICIMCKVTSISLV